MLARVLVPLAMVALVACKPAVSSEIVMPPDPGPTLTPPTITPEPSYQLSHLVLDDRGGCVIADAHVLCWDLDADQAHADLRVAKLVDLDQGSARAIDVSLDERMVCGLFDDARIRCKSLLGSSPLPVTPVATGASRLAMHPSWNPAEDERCVLVGDRLECVVPNLESAEQPTPQPLADVVAIDFNPFLGCALHQDGTRSCWSPGRLAEATRSATPVTGIPAQLELDRRLCIRTDEGRLWCTGRHARDWGQAALEAIDLGGPLVDFSLGAAHLCGIRAEGEVVCQGNNAFAQLGAGDSEPHDKPVEVALPGPARELATSKLGTCALVDAGIWCWGTSDPDLVSTERNTLELAASRLFVDDDQTCAVVGDELRCWGSDEYEIEDTPGGILAASRVQTVQAALPARDIDAIDFATLLGRNTVMSGFVVRHLDPTPIDVLWRKRGVLMFGANGDSLCVVMTKGRRLECLVEDDEGELVPDPRVPAMRNIAALVLRFEQVCVLERGVLRCIEPAEGEGEDEHEDEDEDGASGAAAWLDFGGVTDAIEITDEFSRDEICVLRSTGGVSCWDPYEPDEPYALDVTDAVQTAAYDDLVCARTRAGALTCGPALRDETQMTTQIEAGVVDVVGGFDHLCARIDADGDGKSERIECLGRNSMGQLARLPDTVLLKPTTIKLGP